MSKKIFQENGRFNDTGKTLEHLILREMEVFLNRNPIGENLNQVELQMLESNIKAGVAELVSRRILKRSSLHLELVDSDPPVPYTEG